VSGTPEFGQSKQVDALAALDQVIAHIGGSARDGQRKMAKAVSEAISDGHHLIVQAGTGTGKSFAYLVPAIASGGKVLVATATLALQRQLVERDLPRVEDELSKIMGKPLTFAIYKGIGNYLCKNKMAANDLGFDSELIEGVSSLEKEAKKLRQWAEKPDATGDRDDAPEVDRRVWLAHSVSGRECIGREDCRFGEICFAVKAKDKAMVADVVITNHTLLAIEIVDSHPILPDRDVIILDEAHEFLDRTTQAVTEELTAGRVERAAKMARKYFPSKESDALIKASEDFSDCLADYASDVRSNAEGQARFTQLPAILEKPIRSIKESAESLIAYLRRDSEIIDDEKIGHTAQTKGAVQEILTTTKKLLAFSDKQNSELVAWFEPVFSSIYLAPLSVSHVIAKNMLRQTPVIATSATLTVGGSLNNIKNAIGFSVNQKELSEDDEDEPTRKSPLEPDKVVELDVGSPFDFEKQGILYLPKHLPEPTRDGVVPEVLEELGELIEAAGGRTLALFSSWRGVEAADTHLRKVLAELPIPVITQKRGDSVGALIEKFTKLESSVLIGTLSLWQGIDVPGSACTLVTIDRIPFPRPDEPVFAARSELANKAGGNGFRDVSLPRASLLLAQGTGRLIRSIDDRGVVAILDSRIVNKSYGSTLLKSMPPFWKTNDKKIVKDSLANLNKDFLNLGQ
jgi:ATP-dependent DNA helicase DinG